MRLNLALMLTLILTPPAFAATCYETEKGASPHLTLSWPDRPDEIGQFEFGQGGQSRVTGVSCTFAQPFFCQLDGSLGSFTLTPDASARVRLEVKNGRLTLKLDDGKKDLQVAQEPGAPATYILVPRKPTVCARHFGPDQPRLVFP